MGKIAVLGGTGPEGMGLALRFAQCGETVCLGSRDRARAQAAAEKANAMLANAGLPATIEGDDNRSALDGATIVVFAFPYAGVAELLPGLRGPLEGRIVLDVVNPIEFENGVFRPVQIAAGSAGQEIQAMLPHSFVVSGFKNQSAQELKNLAAPMHGDVLICSDHVQAARTIAALVEKVPHLRAVNAGALVNAHALECMTALLLNINRAYRAITSLQIVGLPVGQ